MAERFSLSSGRVWKQNGKYNQVLLICKFSEKSGKTLIISRTGGAVNVKDR